MIKIVSWQKKKKSFLFTKRRNLLKLKSFSWIFILRIKGYRSIQITGSLIDSKGILFHVGPNSGGAVLRRRAGRRKGPGSNPLSRLSTQPFGVFHCSLRNSLKYRLGSLRKTPTEGTSPTGSGPTSGRQSLKPTTQPYFMYRYQRWSFCLTELQKWNRTILRLETNLDTSQHTSTVILLC